MALFAKRLFGDQTDTTVLRFFEAKLVERLVVKIPDALRPEDMTILGLVGAGATILALMGCNLSPAFLLYVPIGVATNWFGNAMDGALARRRKIDNPRFNFLIDQTSQLTCLVLMFIGFGLSPYFSLTSALLVTTCFLLFSAYNYMRSCAHYARPMSYIGLGTLELRIIMVVWPFVAAAIGPALHVVVFANLSILDVTVCMMSALTMIALVWRAYVDASTIAAEEDREPSTRSESSV